MSNAAERHGDVDAALAGAARALDARPAQAAAQAREILAVVPDEPRAAFLLGAALRRLGDAHGALAALDPLAATQPNAPHAHLERALALFALGREEEARGAFEGALAVKADLSEAWLGLADCHRLAGRIEEADRAYACAIRAATREPRLLEAGAALADSRLAIAESLLRAHLRERPTDVAAIRMLGEVAARLGRFADAEALLARAIELAPGFAAARHNLALVLHRANKPAEALEQIERLCAADPQPSYRNLKAAILARLGEYAGAIALYERLLAEFPQFDRGWLSYGHALKTAGRGAEAVKAYRQAIALTAHFGEAYWSLANMKTYRFSEAEIAAMRAALAQGALSEEDRLHFHFALGKALEDGAEYEVSFTHYAEGARVRKRLAGYDAEDTSQAVRRARALFTPDFFAARAGWGASAPDPIFVVGLPRAGSTLIEQILASHTAVEGTMELPELAMIAKALGARKKRSETSRYPEILAEIDADAARALGEDYLARTRVYRKTGRPFFIDKMPNNWEHAGFIRLILPNAKIVDARRHPLGCCFSGFKQHFARGQRFSYDLEDIGRYYADYVTLMACLDATQPGAVHRVFYEAMIADTEREVRALLAYCGLAFEPACLAFYENERPVRTASSEQVRRPIFADAVDHWRHYEPWLGPLKAALGPCLDTYPRAPGGEAA